MPARPPRSFWRRWQFWFRCARLIVWLTLLLVVCAGLYVTQIGLPNFLKRPLLGVLRERGVDMEYTRMRWLWFRGIVAEDVHFRGTNLTNDASFSAREMELDMNLRALLRGKGQVDGMTLHGGQLVWVMPGTNAPARTNVIEDIQTHLRMRPSDQWELDDFQARFQNIRLTLSGTITNASAIREWKFFSPSASTVSSGAEPATRVFSRARQFTDILERISFPTAPELRVNLAGDARDLQSFTLHLTLSAPEAQTPWGQLREGILTLQIFPAETNLVSHAALRLETAFAHTPWAEVSRLEMEMELDAAPHSKGPINGTLIAQADTVQTRWANATNVQASAQWIHSLTNLLPLSGQATVRAAAAATPWARGQKARLQLTAAPVPNPPKPETDWGWWAPFLPYQLTWDAEVSDMASEKLATARLRCAGSWHAPTLILSNLHAVMPSGDLTLTGALDVPTRQTHFQVASHFDVHALDAVLPEKTRRWLGRYSWRNPPQVQGQGALILPGWTQPRPNWQTEVLPTLCLAGRFGITNGDYLGLQADWAHAHFTYTNRLWRVTDLVVNRPDGRLRLEHKMDEATGDYYWRIHSMLDPRAVRPLLSAHQQAGFDYFTFTTAPVVEGEVWGHAHTPDQLRGRGSVVASNFTFKSEPVTALQTELAYTNGTLQFFKPRIWRGTQHLAAASVTVDFHAQQVHLTNAVSTDVPEVVARAIGPETAHALEPYHFDRPPTVRLEGTVPLRGHHGANLRVDIAGGPFTWWKFNMPQIEGTVFWRDQIITLTNVAAAFYRGYARGWGRFDTATKSGTDLQFDVTATNFNLGVLVADLMPGSHSRLEGTAQASLTITAANSDDWHSWNGYGHAKLRDGWIWEIPIFGILSGPLNALSPGLGNSRLSEGTAGFVITNGVIFSDNLEMRAPTMRLQYTGTLDLEGQVEAVVQAELFRDAWVVGRLVSLALWPVTKMLEYRISGDLNQPKAEPLYLPKLLLAPLRPLRTLRELLPDNPSVPPTNAPSASQSP